MAPGGESIPRGGAFFSTSAGWGECFLSYAHLHKSSNPHPFFVNVFFFPHWKCQINIFSGKCQITPNVCDDHDWNSQWGNWQVSPGPVKPVCHRATIAEDHREQSTTGISDGHDAMMMIPDAKPASWLVKVTINCADCICFIWQPNTLRGSSSYLISLLSYFFPLLSQVQNKHVFFCCFF